MRFGLKLFIAVSFCVYSAAAIAAGTPWNGTWRRAHQKALSPNGVLTFTTKKQITTFVLDANNGANIGQIEGVLTIESETSARFQDQNVPECRLRFTKSAEGIQVEDVDFGCYKAGFGGHNVTFDGEFKNRLPKPPQNLFEMGVLPNAETDQKFKTLVGKHYDAFFQNLEQWGDESMGQKTIISGGISGVYVYMRAILMYDGNGNIWAATSDVNAKRDRDTIYYYTNVAADKNRLPDEIQKWDERFGSDVVYEKGK